MGLITLQPEQLQSWFEQQGKIGIRKIPKDRHEKDKEFKGLNQSTDKKKSQTEPDREAHGIRPKLETQMAQLGQNSTKIQPKKGNNQGQKKDKDDDIRHQTNSFTAQPPARGQCRRQYKNISHIELNSHAPGLHEVSSRRFLTYCQEDLLLELCSQYQTLLQSMTSFSNQDRIKYFHQDQARYYLIQQRKSLRKQSSNAGRQNNYHFKRRLPLN